jgi:hypothetical protein
MYKYLLIVSVLALGACAQQPKQTLAEQEQLRGLRIDASQKVYNDRKPREIFEAVEQMFMYLDEEDFTYELLDENRLVASHYWFLYAVLAVGDRTLYFDIKTDQADADTLVSVVMESKGSGGLQVSPRETFKYDMRYSGVVPTDGHSTRPAGIDDYEAFHAMLQCFVYGQGWYDFDGPKQDRVATLIYMDGLRDEPPEQCVI